MTSTTAATNSSRNFFFSSPPLSERLNERKESSASSVSNKSIENPLMSRDPPALFTAATDAARAGHHQEGGEGLRQRRRPMGVTFRDEKENFYHPHPVNNNNLNNPSVASLVKPSSSLNSGMIPPPPRASSSLGTKPGQGPSFGLSFAMTGATNSNTSQRAAPQSTTMAPMTPQTTSMRDCYTPMDTWTPSNNSSPPSSHHCWVLVFGYATTEQYQQLLERFTKYGDVVSHCGLCQPGKSNWIAIQYASELEARKALCHSRVKLSNNIYCAVQPLADDDEILLLRKNNRLLETHSGSGGSSSLWGIPTNIENRIVMEPSLSFAERGPNNSATAATAVGFSSGGSPNASFPSMTTTSASYRHTSVLTENDILLRGHNISRSSHRPRDSNPCNRVLRWILGVPEYE